MGSILWALIPKKYLIAAAALVALLVGGWGAVALHEHRLKQAYFDKGASFVRDSATEATILRLAAQHARDTAAADSAVARARATSAPLDSAAKRLSVATEHRHIVISADTTGLVNVTSLATGKHWLLPRDAALEWSGTDSLLSVATELLRKYAAANKDWSAAWQAEHNARLGADSLVALYAARLRNATALPASSHAKRDLVYAALGATLALVVRAQLHHR